MSLQNHSFIQDINIRDRSLSTIHLLSRTQRSCSYHHILQFIMYSSCRVLFHMGTKAWAPSAHLIAIFFRIRHRTASYRAKLYRMCRLVDRQLYCGGSDIARRKHVTSDSYCGRNCGDCDPHYRGLVHGLSCGAPL